MNFGHPHPGAVVGVNSDASCASVKPNPEDRSIICSNIDFPTKERTIIALDYDTVALFQLFPLTERKLVALVVGNGGPEIAHHQLS
jgi:hypothetical protein